MYLIKIIVLSSVLLFSHTFAAKTQEDVEISRYKEAQNEIEYIIHSNDANNSDKIRKSYTTFPSTHPSTVSAKTFAWYDDSFKIYLWRDASNVVWVEIDPINDGTPFICGAGYDIAINNIIQTDSGYGIVNLRDTTGVGFCDTVYEKTILKLATWPDQTQNDNLNNAFDLYFLYDSLGSTYVISLGALGSSSNNTTSQQNADKLFNWAESTYDDLFPGNQNSLEASPWYFRYYSSVDTYLGYNSSNNHIYILGDAFGGLVDVGDLDAFLNSAGLSSGNNPSGESSSSYPSESDLIGSYTIDNGNDKWDEKYRFFDSDSTHPTIPGKRGRHEEHFNINESDTGYAYDHHDDFYWSYKAGTVTITRPTLPPTTKTIKFNGSSIILEDGTIIKKDGGSTSTGTGSSTSSCNASSGQLIIEDGHGPTLYDSSAYWTTDVWKVWEERYVDYSPGIAITAFNTVANVSLYIKSYNGPQKYLLEGVNSNYPSEEWAFAGADNGVYSTDDVGWPFYIDPSRTNGSYIVITSDNGRYISGDYKFTAYDETRELRRDVYGCFKDLPKN